MRQFFIVLGVVFLAAGLLWPYLSNAWTFLDRLPGNIRIQRPGFQFYFPLATCVLVSVLVSLVLSLFRKR